MKPMNLRSTIAALLAILTSAVLSSFAPAPGGYSYEVYINNQLVMKEHLHGRTEVPSLPLQLATAHDELAIMFNNCNKVDAARKISLKDERDVVLKQWAFKDSPDIKNKMNIKVSEIAAFRDKHSTAKLVYSSQDIDTGVHVINIQLSDATALKK